MFFYQERTIRKDGDALAFIARHREGPNLSRQDAVLSPAGLDRFGDQIAEALNQQQAARAMLAALKECVSSPHVALAMARLYPNGTLGGPNLCVMATSAIAAAEAAGITAE